MLAYLCCTFQALPSGFQSHSKPATHSIRGRVLIGDSYRNTSVKVALASTNGTIIGERTLGYDGTFSYEDLPTGSYVLTIERPNSATIARPVQIKQYPTPKTVFLEIRLAADDASAIINEVVREYSHQKAFEREETQTIVSKKAAREFQKALEESGKGNSLQAIEHLKKAEKDAHFSEDDRKRGEQDAQKLTDKFIKDIDALVAQKEKEIMEV